jgi:hypothetical protein
MVKVKLQLCFADSAGRLSGSFWHPPLSSQRRTPILKEKGDHG